MVHQKIREGGRTAYELEIQAKNGQRLTLEVSSRLIERQEKSIGVQGIARDISDRKRLEEQLRQAQKMEAIGRLAGGVAHDFNNLLTGIIGYSELILHRLPPGHPLAPDVEGIRHAAERAAGLTYQLLAFSRKQLLAPKVLNLNNVLVDLVRMLERLIREDIKLVLELEPNLERVEVDLVQLQQVIINLVVNARDAMPRGGRLTLATANIDLDGVSLGQEGRTVRCVMLSVRDTGCGMTEEVRARLFEPFFTTKDVGKGTGLGLSTIYGIVKQSGGHIDVVSAPNMGTTFKIYLPCYESTAPSEDRPHKPHVLATGNETVLVVEDEEMVRKVICLVLAKHGYHVLQAPDGQRALRLCERYPASIDLLVTDLVMPEMSGRQLAEQLAATRPHVRTLYLSGYTDDTVARQSVHGAQKSFLQKPFSPETLARKVREVLDS